MSPLYINKPKSPFNIVLRFLTYLKQKRELLQLMTCNMKLSVYIKLCQYIFLSYVMYSTTFQWFLSYKTCKTYVIYIAKHSYVYIW